MEILQNLGIKTIRFQLMSMEIDFFREIGSRLEKIRNNVIRENNAF